MFIFCASYKTEEPGTVCSLQKKESLTITKIRNVTSFDTKWSFIKWNTNWELSSVTKCSRTAIWAPALQNQLDNITNSSSKACRNTTIVQAQIEAHPMNIMMDDTAESLRDDYANSSQHSPRRSYLTDKRTKKLKWKKEICSRLAREHFSICHNSYFLSNRMLSDILLINQRLYRDVGKFVVFLVVL